MMPTLVQTTPHSNGRHPASFWVGLDIGGTKTHALVVEQATGAIVGQATGPTQVDTPSKLVAGIVDVVQKAVQAAGIRLSQVTAVGAGVPGQVAPLTGEVHLAANLHLSAYPLGAELTAALQTPVFLENDGRLAALGAYQQLYQPTALQNMAYLSIGTGISAGLILNGRLYRGSHGMAGEIGHIIVEPNGRLCNCGLRGCLETVAAGPAILQTATASQEWPSENLTTARVYQLAQAGDPTAQSIVQNVSLHLSRALHILVMSYDVEKIVLGGGVTHAGTAFLSPVLAELSRLRHNSPLAQAMLPDDKITLLPDGFNAGAWGAIALAKSALFSVNPHPESL